MNPFSVAIPVILIGSFVLEVIVELLNLSHIKTALPKEFQKLYKPKKYARSQHYLRTTTWFGLIHSHITLPLTLAFIWLGGFNYIDTYARSFGLADLGTAVIFTSILLVLVTMSQLPFTWYSTFVIEQKFGFNKTTKATFILDLVKNLGLTLVISGLVIATIVWFFDTTGSWAWVISWVAIIVLQMVLTFVAPVLIMPLFNKFTPLPKGELKTAIEAFAKAQNFKLSGIFTMDGSKRSTKANAYFTGFGRFKRIVLFDTLIKDHTTDELVSVLAHEIGHYKHKHIHKMFVVSILTTGFMLFSFSGLINHPQLFAAFGMTHTSTYASLVFISLLFSPVNQIVSVAVNWLSRHHEFEADSYAVTSYKNPTAFSSALKKLTVKNLSNLYPHPVKVFIDYSHPPVLERINNIRSKEVEKYRGTKA